MEIIIEKGKIERQYWRDIWRYRELMLFLAWRDILIRYKQTFIGVGWAVIRPLLTMFVLTVVFGVVARMPSGTSPYPVLVFSAMVPWQFFASAFSDSGSSLIANSGMISKIYFPRLIIPVSGVITSLVDFMISFVLLLLLMWIYQCPIHLSILALPFFVILAVGAALGAGLWASSLMVAYRDIRYIIPFIVQFGLYISPVGFSSHVIPEKWKIWYSLNPMVGVIDGFRWSILGDNSPFIPSIISSVLIVLVLIATGIRYFRATEKTFADVI
ncbi:MAG: ABC transporter permease [Akkermansiaceae bacterium]|jgi:lipopolysaccharide transport system permease protein|nr:ABC transporter permease [Akkermansiaceae bacterium]